MLWQIQVVNLTTTIIKIQNISVTHRIPSCSFLISPFPYLHFLAATNLFIFRDMSFSEYQINVCSFLVLASCTWCGTWDSSWWLCVSIVHPILLLPSIQLYGCVIVLSLHQLMDIGFILSLGSYEYNCDKNSSLLDELVGIRNTVRNSQTVFQNGRPFCIPSSNIWFLVAVHSY